MPAKKYTKMHIFVASPGDVSPERQKVKLVADELNQTGGVADALGITIEVLDWQTHISPAMGRPESEWVENLYGHEKYQSVRVLRGGAWDSDPVNLRCDARNRFNPDDVWDDDGFRVVCLQS